MDRIVARLERRLGRYAPSGITAWLVGLTGLAYVMIFLRPALYTDFTLEPHSLAAGEWWRVVTFLFLPWNVGSGPLGPIWMLFALMIFYTMGTALESAWGSFRFDLFYLLAALGTVAACLVLGAGGVTNVFINQSLFLAFATEFPDYELMIFFILPVKVKWLGLVMGAFFLYQLAVGDFTQRASIVVALAAFLLFCGGTLRDRLRGKLRETSQARGNSPAANAFTPAPRRARICARCGKTEKDDPALEFRICDCAEKCHGKPTEYCLEHARAH